MVTLQIWKYELQPGPQAIKMPRGAEPLTVAVQGDTACVWCKVDPALPMVSHGFFVVGTGHSFIDEGGVYIGTMHLPNGLVFHAFDFGEHP